MWSGPSDKYLDRWIDATNKLLEAKSMQRVLCPSCGHDSLRVFFRRRDSNRGAGWVWCPKCHTAHHFQCVIPSWWVPVSIEQSVWLAEDPWDLLDNSWEQISSQNPSDPENAPKNDE